MRSEIPDFLQEFCFNKEYYVKKTDIQYDKSGERHRALARGDKYWVRQFPCSKCGEFLYWSKANSCVNCDRNEHKANYVHIRPEQEPERIKARSEGKSTYTSQMPCQFGHLIRLVHYGRCLECERVKRNIRWARRRAAKLQRTPIWVDYKAIENWYSKARILTKTTGIVHHVDHIIPLRGELVSGFHVETNLQCLPKLVNSVKKNRFQPFYETPDGVQTPV